MPSDGGDDSGTETTEASSADDEAPADDADDVGGADGAGPATDEELALEFAQCMRDNGVPEFEDPAVAADGSIDFGGQAQSGDLDLDLVADAFEICGDIIAGASFLPTNGIDTTELEDDLLAFAQCLRDFGHDVADPDLSGPLVPGPDGPGGMFASGFDPLDPANAADVAQCQADTFGPGGPGGFAQGGN
ncbi:MAG: hypothetical protein AAF547_17015 [Actinomycetota bacterium]